MSFLAIPAFVFLLGVIGLLWQPPLILAAVYLGLSALTFAIYALDKSAARKNRRRISEGTLHLLSLAGGWPGALIGQNLLRHKSSKAPFRFVFWVTVFVNCALSIALALPTSSPLPWIGDTGPSMEFE